MVAEFTDILKERVLEYPNIASQIGVRFYIGELATIKGPKFPCINIETNASTLVEKMPEFSQPPFRLWVWGKTRNQITDIYNTFFDKYNNTLIQDELQTTNILLYETSRPIYNYDQTILSFALLSRWLATVITP